MRTLDDKIALAEACLAFCGTAAQRPRRGRRHERASDRSRIVPVKALGEAKQRLGAALSAAARRKLVLAMLDDVLATLGGSSRVERRSCHAGRGGGGASRGARCDVVPEAADSLNGACAPACAQRDAAEAGASSCPPTCPW